MKKIFWVLMFTTAFSAKAQDFKKVNNLVLINQMESARVELDKLMSDPKAEAKPDGWYYKFKIFAFFYKDDKFKLKYPNAEIVADESFKKYVAVDPSLKLLKDFNGQDALFNLYATSFNKGISTFNAKNWDSASYYFSIAVRYSDIIFQNKFSTNLNQVFDTTSILYAGYSAQNSKKADDAVFYYNRLINSKIGGANYIDIYKYCLIYFINKKNRETFDKYLGISKSIYPNAEWEDYEMSYFSKNYTLQEKFELYDKEDKEGTISARKYLQYGDAFNRVSKDDVLGADSIKQDIYLHKAADAFKKAFYKNPDGISAFNAGIIYYNLFVLYDEKSNQARRTLQDLNSSVENDPKKKSSAQYKTQVDALKNIRISTEKPINESADSSIIWLEKEFNFLKDKKEKSREEKNCLNKSVDYLSNIYMYKREKARGKDVKALDAFDTKFKFYDDFHGKF